MNVYVIIFIILIKLLCSNDIFLLCNAQNFTFTDHGSGTKCRHIAMATDGSKIYTTGLWKSENSGTSWSKMTVSGVTLFYGICACRSCHNL